MGNNLIFLGGMALAAGVGLYLYQGGYFNQLFDAINKAIAQIGNTKPAGGSGGGGGGSDSCAQGKVKCKDGKCSSQSTCDKQCKATEKWDATKKKCVVKSGSKLAIAYVTPMIAMSRHKAYRVFAP